MTDDVATASPMMAQYLAIKAGHPDALLFYRMGDFYEMFFADAEAGSAALDIALTARGRHRGEDIKMCGVPVHAAEGYLLTLIRKGFRVAICEQVEDPAEARKRGAKAVVAREVTRLVTPGTLTEETLLDARSANHLAALAEVRGEGAFAWVEMSTGAVGVAPCEPLALGPLLARIAPREVLLAEGAPVPAALAESGAVVTPLPAGAFDSVAGERGLRRLYSVASVEGWGTFGRAELGALGALAGYIEATQKGRLPHLAAPVREEPGAVMQIDAATRRNLEIGRALGGGRDGSLLATIDRTVTGAGARLLEARLGCPSAIPGVIRARHDAVEALIGDTGLRERLRDMLRKVPDLERALARLALGRGGPRDLAAIRNGLGQAGAVADLVAGLAGDLPALLADARRALEGHEALVATLDAALAAEPPHLVRDGGAVAAGHHAELDECRRLAADGRGAVAALEDGWRRETAIPSLKVRHNNVLGYFIETTATHAARMLAPPLSARFVHRQTTAGAVRFTTLELSTLETRILNAGARALDIEREVIEGLGDAVRAEAPHIAGAARALAEIDLAAALAELARREDWTRPAIHSDRRFRVRDGRHPVVEAALRRGGTPFVPNDCDLGERRLWLVTGPNMGGKSTFLRQNALIALLAQAGSFVPAAEAEIGVVTQLFSRVGAADELARGRSTFMVEMVETAAILNRAGPGALVILDEIGRGTATWDGLSIAWAAIEHLHETNRCRTLFATHYHELTALADRLPGLANATVAVREWQGEVVFLHKVGPGAADRSWGVQVARLAGLPAPVLARAREVLAALEKGERDSGRKRLALIDDLPLFAAARVPPAPTVSAVEERLRAILPDTLSPREALDLVYELRGLLEKQ